MPLRRLVMWSSSMLEKFACFYINVLPHKDHSDGVNDKTMKNDVYKLNKIVIEQAPEVMCLARSLNEWLT